MAIVFSPHICVEQLAGIRAPIFHCGGDSDQPKYPRDINKMLLLIATCGYLSNKDKLHFKIDGVTTGSLL